MLIEYTANEYAASIENGCRARLIEARIKRITQGGGGRTNESQEHKDNHRGLSLHESDVHPDVSTDRTTQVLYLLKIFSGFRIIELNC